MKIVSCSPLSKLWTCHNWEISDVILLERRQWLLKSSRLLTPCIVPKVSAGSNIFFIVHQGLAGFELRYLDLGNMIHFSIFMMQMFPSSQKITIPKYDSFLFQKRNFFFAAVKNNFNMTGVDKSLTCVRYVLEILNFTNCRTWLVIF